jgi:exodeoxyribonuclease VII small subunit
MMTEISFEKALEELEDIVEKLEKGGLSLNESLALFEKGVKLARQLREELQKAEKKVEILLKDEKNEIKTEAFTLEEKHDSMKTKTETETEPEAGDDKSPF